jgi:4-amino-4-deoxy-L-arabinose transferase-like glycosyltransferase
MPWSAFAVGAAAAGLASLARRQWSPSRDDLRLVFWAVVPTLFFMASVGQQPRYVLPVLPPLAILTARAIGERIEAARAEPRTALLASATWATAATLVLCAGLLYRLQPLLVATPPPSSRRRSSASPPAVPRSRSSPFAAHGLRCRSPPPPPR